MNNNPVHNEPLSGNLQEKILEKIRMEKITMRPKIYFTLVFIAMVLVSLLVLGVTLFLFSYIIFSVRASSDLFLLGFGLRGLLMFLLFFPWKFFLLDIVLIFLLEWLLRQFSFGYKRSVMYVLIGILVVLLASSILIEREIHFHARLENAGGLGLPVIGGMYTHVRQPPPHEKGVCRCIVTAIDGNMLTLIDDNPKIGTTTTIRIFLPDGSSTSTIQVGDRVFVAGDVVNGEIHAYGIRKLDPQD